MSQEMAVRAIGMYKEMAVGTIGIEDNVDEKVFSEESIQRMLQCYNTLKTECCKERMN